MSNNRKRDVSKSETVSWENLQSPVTESLLELSDCLFRVCLSGDDEGLADMGPHVRHCLDYFHALKLGADSGVIDYNARRRGHPAENNAAVALTEMSDLLLWLRSSALDDKPVTVIAEYSNRSQAIGQFSSSLLREMLHVIEHTVHHIAFIVAIAGTRGIKLSKRSGVAAATQSFRRQRQVN